MTGGWGEGKVGLPCALALSLWLTCWHDGASQSKRHRRLEPLRTTGSVSFTVADRSSCQQTLAKHLLVLGVVLSHELDRRDLPLHLEVWAGCLHLCQSGAGLWAWLPGYTHLGALSL